MSFSVVCLCWVVWRAQPAIVFMLVVKMLLKKVTQRYSLTRFTCRMTLSEIACGVLPALRCAASRVGMTGGSDLYAVVRSHHLSDERVPCIACSSSHMNVMREDLGW